MGRLLDEDDVVDWLLKRTEMYDATGHFVDENVVKKNIESQIAKIPSAQPDTRSLEQIKWERDIAIQQLKDLGYSLGEKIRTDGDTISRQALMKEFSDFVRASNNSDFARTPTWNDAVSLVGSMPSAQPEPAIPLQWIEAQIEWLKSMDNAFSTLTAVQISAMVNKWKGEHDG